MPRLMLPRTAGVRLAQAVANGLEAWHHGDVHTMCSAPGWPCSDHAGDERTPRLERSQPTLLLQRQPSPIA